MRWTHVVAGLAAAAVFFAGLTVARLTVGSPAGDSPAFTETVDRVAGEEGYRALPYRDQLGFLTIGYGLCIDADRCAGLSEAEARAVLELRLQAVHDELAAKWEPFEDQPADVRWALVDAAFQLGVSGLLGFHHALAALSAGDRDGAAEAFRASRWDTETPDRVERLVSIIQGEP